MTLITIEFFSGFYESIHGAQFDNELEENSDDIDYRIDIAEPLLKEICCRWVTDGKITYSVEDTEVASVNYETTTCVNPSAVLEYGNKEFVFVFQ